MRTAVLIVLLVLMAIFAILNHTSLMFPHTVNLGFVTYEKSVPLGLMLLLLAVILMLLFYFWAGITRLRAQADSAKLLRDLDALRTSLDTQEGSRFAQLQAHLDERLKALPSSTGSSAEIASLSNRIDALQRDVNLQLAQLDDYLKRKLG